MVRRIAPLSVVFFVVACMLGGNRDAQPDIRSLTATGTLTDAEDVQVVAVVDHPSGPENIVQGTLETVEGVVFGHFEQVGEDRWVYDASWEDITSVSPVSFDVGTDLIVFARFESAWEVTASEQLELPMACENAVDVACSGACVDTDVTPAHCGTCGNACLGCDAGDCVGLSRCFTLDVSDDGTSPYDLCRRDGLDRCVPATFDGQSNVILVQYDSASCSNDVRVYTTADFPCESGLGFPQTFYLRAMCAE